MSLGLPVSLQIGPSVADFRLGNIVRRRAGKGHDECLDHRLLQQCCSTIGGVFVNFEKELVMHAGDEPTTDSCPVQATVSPCNRPQHRIGANSLNWKIAAL